jgi:hypothetical protein
MRHSGKTAAQLKAMNPLRIAPTSLRLPWTKIQDGEDLL